MEIKLYQVDAFADGPFTGNPAAVCPLQTWLDDDVMQQIAAENNLSETAFLVGGNGRYDLRWFTPTVEIDMCGHATLASGYVVLTHLEPDASNVSFSTRSGELRVERNDDLFLLSLPALQGKPMDTPPELADALGGVAIEECIDTPRDVTVRVADANAVRDLRPDFKRLVDIHCGLVVVTAPGGVDDGCDFVSRCFGPSHGIDEDPVTGSTHCQLVPYWAERLGKDKLIARQLSARGGTLYCEVQGERVMLAGRVMPYLEGVIRF